MPHGGWRRRCARTTGTRSLSCTLALALALVLALALALTRYTEPELYAVISSLCAMLPDHGVLRKEMVRRGFLHPPEIFLNSNHTTSTYYTVNPEGLLAWRSEWRPNG